MKRILKEPEFDIDFVLDTKPDIEFKTEEKPAQETIDNQSSPDTLDIYMIGTTPLAQLTRKPKHTIFTVTMADIKKALALKKYIDLVIKVPIEHHKYLDVFSR